MDSGAVGVPRETAAAAAIAVVLPGAHRGIAEAPRAVAGGYVEAVVFSYDLQKQGLEAGPVPGTRPVPHDRDIFLFRGLLFV